MLDLVWDADGKLVHRHSSCFYVGDDKGWGSAQMMGSPAGHDVDWPMLAAAPDPGPGSMRVTWYWLW